jgi:hypothetical protein
MRLQGLGRGGRHELLDAAVGNESLRVVAHYPDPESGSSYQRVVSYWDRESCVLVRSEMWEQGESPRKVLTVDPNTVFSSKGAKIPRNLLMTDMRDKSSTHLSIDEIEIDVKMSKKLFSAAALGRN